MINILFKLAKIERINSLPSPYKSQVYMNDSFVFSFLNLFLKELFSKSFLRKKKRKKIIKGI